jgi:apolipoprotein N-acyltransferase
MATTRNALIAGGLSAVAAWYGTGLHPQSWLTWLAPLPLLILATRCGPRISVATAFVAWLAGGFNLWSFYRNEIELPTLVVAGYLVVQALVVAGVVLLLQHLVRRERTVLAILAPPASYAGAEYLLSLVSPAGAFSALGYTQADVAPVVQIASVTGIWGVSFLIFAVSAAIAVLERGPRRQAAALTLAVLVTVALGYGGWRASASPTPAVTVAMVDTPQSTDGLTWGTAEADRVLDRYLAAVSGTTADAFVLPEKVFRVTPADLTELEARLRQAAGRATVVIGLTLRDGAGVHNIALAVSPAGVTRYDKQHLVPGLEDHFTAGQGLVVLPGTGYGLAVCKDLDYPSLSRAYAGAGAGLLLVPALDFDVDGWLHSRIAIVRGVESGLSVVRASDRGRLTASDAIGRRWVDAPTGAGVSMATVSVPVGSGRTPYAMLGDWFAWLCLALAGLSLVVRRGTAVDTESPAATADRPKSTVDS